MDGGRPVEIPLFRLTEANGKGCIFTVPVDLCGGTIDIGVEASHEVKAVDTVAAGRVEHIAPQGRVSPRLKVLLRVDPARGPVVVVRVASPVLGVADGPGPRASFDRAACHQHEDVSWAHYSRGREQGDAMSCTDLAGGNSSHIHIMPECWPAALAMVLYPGLPRAILVGLKRAAGYEPLPSIFLKGTVLITSASASATARHQHAGSRLTEAGSDWGRDCLDGLRPNCPSRQCLYGWLRCHLDQSPGEGGSGPAMSRGHWDPSPG